MNRLSFKLIILFLLITAPYTSSQFTNFITAKNDYGFYTPVIYSAGNLPDGAKYIKIVLKNKPQISRTEIK